MREEEKKEEEKVFLDCQVLYYYDVSDWIGPGGRSGTPSAVCRRVGSCHPVAGFDANQHQDQQEDEEDDHGRGEEVVGEA